MLETLNPEDKIDEEILDKIYEKKLESRQFDLAGFHPSTSYVMPTNLEFGSKFIDEEGNEVTFSSIDDVLGTKNNAFTAQSIITVGGRDGTVENTVEIDTLFNTYFDKQSGILLVRSSDAEITNLNTRESGWLVLEMSYLDRSSDVKSTNISKPINDRNEILEKLSYFFVESANSEYLFTDGVESIGEPKRTTFDIIRVSDGYELGSLILYGDDEISLIRSSTLVGGAVQALESDRIHGLIVLSFEPSCESFVPDHFDLLLENSDEGNAFVETMCDDINVKRSWTETDPVWKTGAFVQEITFSKQKVAEQKSKNPSADDNELLFNPFPYLQIYEDLIITKPNNIKFDPTLVEMSEKVFPAYQDSFKLILEQCHAVDSYTNYLAFEESIPWKQSGYPLGIEDMKKGLSGAEELGYDNHPTIGQLIKAARVLEEAVDKCIIDLQDKYENNNADRIQDAIINDPLYDVSFDPQIVSAAKESIPDMQVGFRTFLGKCNAIDSYSDYLIFATKISIVQEELAQIAVDTDESLMILEVLGYDKHPSVGPLIEETRQLMIDSGECLTNLAKEYEN